jgi:lipoate-protein ligase A
MAIDRAILVANSLGNVPPTVRFYGWIPPAISLGYFQSVAEEIDISACKKLGVDYVRRITGGGAVFHDKELTYSIVIPEVHPSIPKNILQSYERICNALLQGLTQLGIQGTYAPINDILVDGKKISGNAQTRKANTVLQHGTILLDVDVDTMFSLLKVPNEKIKDKLIRDIKQRVTSIEHIVGKKIRFEEVAEALKVGFEKEFHVELVSGILTNEEKILSVQFEKECFSTTQWNHRR